MSQAAFGQRRDLRKLCQSCRRRKARFAYRGRVKADPDHTLCFECYRQECQRRRAIQLAQRPARHVSVFVRQRPVRPTDRVSSAAHANPASGSAGVSYSISSPCS
jgi:hypothetical protein